MNNTEVVRVVEAVTYMSLSYLVQ